MASTWADGYGNWHASVPVSTPARQAREARKLIMGELMSRGCDPAYFTMLRVSRDRVHCAPDRVVYRELAR